MPQEEGQQEPDQINRIAEGVVDRLEMIEVKAENGEALAAAHALQPVLQLLMESHPIRQTGQRIVMRHVGEATAPSWRHTWRRRSSEGKMPTIADLLTALQAPHAEFLN